MEDHGVGFVAVVAYDDGSGFDFYSARAFKTRAQQQQQQQQQRRRRQRQSDGKFATPSSTGNGRPTY
jgi:hypothetical protein